MACRWPMIGTGSASSKLAEGIRRAYRLDLKSSERRCWEDGQDAHLTSPVAVSLDIAAHMAEKHRPRWDVTTGAAPVR